MGVDPARGKKSDPQRLNRYSYVLNDPINLIDPDGADPASPWDTDLVCDSRTGTDCVLVTTLNPNYSPFRRQRNQQLGFWRRLFPTFEQRVNRALDKLEDKLDKNISDPDCAQIFTTLGVDYQTYRNGLDARDYQNGTQSQQKIEDLVNEPYARANGILGWTVADLFEKGFPQGSPNYRPDSRLDAWTPPGGDQIFLRPGAVNAAVLGHENFHKFGLYDSDLLRTEWGLDPNGASSQFTDYFKKKCLK